MATPETEDEKPYAAEVEPQGTHHHWIASAGADDEPDVGALEKQPQSEQRESRDGEDEQAVGGEDHEAQVYPAREGGRAGRG